MRKGIVMLLLAVLAVVETAQGMRAAGGWQVATQSDGSQIEVMLCGDEWLHFFVTRDGVPLLEDEDGDLCYADAYGFGMKSSGIVAHELGERTDSELRYVGSLKSVESIAANARAEGSGLRRAVLQPTHHVGHYEGLVVLAQFPDQPFHSPTVQSDYKALLNAEGYDGDSRAVGSVRDYFLAQSHGLFSLTFDVLGPVTVSKNHDQYNTNELVRSSFMPEVLDAISDEADLSYYDWDGDGEVEQVLVIFAGYGANEYNVGNESTLKAKDCIWPIEWELNPVLPIGGRKVNTFACVNELTVQGDGYSGIGTICHEFSHCMGLPDMYDTFDLPPGSDGGIMDTWDIMDGGGFVDGGWCPSNYSAYQRAYCGWLTPTELTADTIVADMPSLSESDVAYKVVNKAGKKGIDEYYLLENRQQKGWDRGQPGHGLLVWHVDYSASVWRNNRVNADLTHLRCVAIPADDDLLCHYEGRRRYLNGAPYPYTNSDGVVNDELTDTSVPAATLFNANAEGSLFMGKPIKNIAEASDGTVSFRFFASNASAQAFEAKAGDVNGDGHVDVGDIMAIINVMATASVAKTVGDSVDTGSRADVNGDGTVDVGDIMGVINIMAGGNRKS